MSRKVLLVVIILALGCAGGVGYELRPVCVPISDNELKNFNSPIEQRADRDFYLKVFQQRDGHWYQCKTALSRSLFF